jgi:hypothetical protein
MSEWEFEHYKKNLLKNTQEVMENHPKSLKEHISLIERYNALKNQDPTYEVLDILKTNGVITKSVFEQEIKLHNERADARLTERLKELKRGMPSTFNHETPGIQPQSSSKELSETDRTFQELEARAELEVSTGFSGYDYAESLRSTFGISSSNLNKLQEESREANNNLNNQIKKMNELLKELSGKSKPSFLSKVREALKRSANTVRSFFRKPKHHFHSTKVKKEIALQGVSRDRFSPNPLVQEPSHTPTSDVCYNANITDINDIARSLGRSIPDNQKKDFEKDFKKHNEIIEKINRILDKLYHEIDKEPLNPTSKKTLKLRQDLSKINKSISSTYSLIAASSYPHFLKDELRKNLKKTNELFQDTSSKFRASRYSFGEESKKHQEQNGISLKNNKPNSKNNGLGMD